MQPTDQTSTVRLLDLSPLRADAFLRCGNCDTRTCFGVALEAQHDLRCTIPAGRHVFRHEAGILIRIYGEATS